MDETELPDDDGDFLNIDEFREEPAPQGQQKDAKGRFKPKIHRCTKEELQERLDYVLNLLRRRLYGSHVRQLVKKRFNVTVDTVDLYIRKAKAMRLKETGKTPEQAKKDSLDFYESIISGSDATLRDRMEAQSRIDRMLGMESPIRLAHGGDDESPAIKVEAQVEVRECVVRTREEASRILGQTNGPVPDSPGPGVVP